MAELMGRMEEKIKEVPYVEKLLAIHGIGLKTVCGFLAEVGELSRFDNPKQVQKLAGYAIVKNDSGKHAGESHISYRGRKRLRYVLYEAAISVIGKNAEFREIHQYYQTRDRNPLKKMQSEKANVIRNGISIPTLDATQLVPGDIIRVSTLSSLHHR